MSDHGDHKLQLEMLVTEHERLLDQFSDLIQDHQAQIDRLKQKLANLERRLAQNDEAGINPIIDEPPPHY